MSIIGNRTKAKVVKNKVAPPFREAEFDILYGQGISKVGELIDIGVKLELIEKAGAWYTINGIRMQGKDGLREYLQTTPEAYEKLEKEIRENTYKLTSRGKMPEAAPAAPIKPIDITADDFDEE